MHLWEYYSFIRLLFCMCAWGPQCDTSVTGQTNAVRKTSRKDEIQTCPSPVKIWLYELTSDHSLIEVLSASRQISDQDRGGWIFILKRYWSIHLGGMILIRNTCTTSSCTCDFAICVWFFLIMLTKLISHQMDVILTYNHIFYKCIFSFSRNKSALICRLLQLHVFAAQSPFNANSIFTL